MIQNIKDRLIYRLVFLFILIVLLPIGVVSFFVYSLILQNHKENIQTTLTTGARYINTAFSHSANMISASAVRLKDDFRLYKELDNILRRVSDEAEFMNFLRSFYEIDCFQLKSVSGGINISYSDKIKNNPDLSYIRGYNSASIDFNGSKFVASVMIIVSSGTEVFELMLAKEIDDYNLYEVGKSLGFDFILFEEDGEVLKNRFSTLYDSYGFVIAGGNLIMNKGDAVLEKVSDLNILSSKRKIYLFRLPDFSSGKVGAVTLVEDVSYVQSAKKHFILLLLIFTGLLFILGAFIRYQIVTPIVELLEGIGSVSHQIDTERPIEPLSVNSAGEIGRLAEEYNRMASNLGRSFSRIKYLQNYLLNIFESMPSGLIAVDNSGKITQWNRTAEKYSSGPDRISKGEEVWTAVKELGIYKDELLKIIGERSRIEISRALLMDGEKKNININLFPLVSNGVRGSVIRIDDITELKKKEEQLIQAQKMETIGTLAGGIAHDFNNILSGIVGVVSILKYRIDKKIEIPVEQLEEYLDIMEKSGHRAGDIVQRLLTLSRKQNTLMEKVELSEVISQVIKICSNTFDKRIEIAGENLQSKAAIMADFTQIEQVILNLAINASHAMTIMRPEGENYGGVLKFEICENIPEREIFKLKAPRDDKEYVRVSVRDTGVGMDSSTVKQIFEPFFSTKDKGLGTGLGLTIVYNIVQQFGGIIDVDSVPSAGTVFSLYFPKYESMGCDLNKNSEAFSIRKGRGTILVIDDEPVLRELARSMLGQAGYDVVAASDGKEGIDIYRQDPDRIDLVMLDMIMPVIDGRETFRELKKIRDGVKVIITSGFARDRRIEDVIAEGAKDFVQKPYTIYDLTEKVYRVLYNDDKS